MTFLPAAASLPCIIADLPAPPDGLDEFVELTPAIDIPPKLLLLTSSALALLDLVCTPIADETSGLGATGFLLFYITGLLTLLPVAEAPAPVLVVTPYGCLLDPLFWRATFALGFGSFIRRHASSSRFCRSNLSASSLSRASRFSRTLCFYSSSSFLNFSSSSILFYSS